MATYTRQLKEVILEQKNSFQEKQDYIERDALQKVGEYLKLPHTIIITGMRRAGKSTLLKQIKDTYYKNKTIYYLNFEDERLIDFTVEDFNTLYETFMETQGKSKTFLFDEIQNIPGWERFIRRMYDKKNKFIITGSNSSLLSKELASKLTGRYVNIELYPFSFQEYLRYKKIKQLKQDLTEDRAKIKAAYHEYLQKGGIPEYLKYENKDQLKTLYDNILYRDILARYKLNDEKTLKELASYLYANYAKEISYNQLKKMLSVGSANTIKNYINYLENSYLTFTIPKYDYSIKKQIYSRKKSYVIDNALIDLISFKYTQNKGRILENLVFLELKRRNKEIYYHKNKHECDFLITKTGKVTEAIQVTTDIEDNNREREIRGIIEALKTYKLKEGLILTENQEKEEEIENKKIHIKPIWKWLLQ